jgi:hypothetical protein
VPTVHEAHATAPVAAWYNPAAQLAHTLAPDAEYDPPLHALHAASPVLASYKPAVQLVQLLAPAAEYKPAAQLSQLDGTKEPSTAE